MKKLFALGIIILLWNSTSNANPIASEAFRVKQVYDSTHVQITFYSMGKEKPISIEKDGNPMTVSWQGSQNISLNTGSGIESVDTFQICDCNVSIGKHSYLIGYKPYGSDYTLTQADQIDVLESYPAPEKLDAGVAGADMQPWDMPEPTEMQGLDCLKVCDSTQTIDGSVEPEDAGIEPKLDSGVAKDANTTIDSGVKVDADDSGCAVGGQGSLIGFAALFLFALIRRRR